MTWASLHAVRLTTRLEFTRALALLHHFVKLPSGRWTRTLGPPGLLPEQRDRLRTVHVHGRVWHTVAK